MAYQMKKPLYISKNAIPSYHIIKICQNMTNILKSVPPPLPPPKQCYIFLDYLWKLKNVHSGYQKINIVWVGEGEGGLQIYKFILQFDLCLLKFCPRLYIKTNLYRLYVSQFRPWHGHIAEKRIIFQIIIPISLGPNVYGVFPL